MNSTSATSSFDKLHLPATFSTLASTAYFICLRLF